MDSDVREVIRRRIALRERDGHDRLLLNHEALRALLDAADERDRLAGNRREPRDFDWDWSVDNYQVSISVPLSARLGETRLGLRAKRIGTVEHAYSHGALDLTRKALDLAQAWIDKEGPDDHR